MPTIPFIRDLKNQTKKKKKTAPMLSVSQKVYNKARWKKLRESYFADHPLCENCLKQGKIVPATDVHHIRPFLTGHTFQEQMELAFDYNNLMSLCKECHIQKHKELNKKKTSSKV